MKSFLKYCLLFIFLPLSIYAQTAAIDYLTSHDIIENKQRYQVIDTQLTSHELSYYGIREKIKELKLIHQFALKCSLQREKMISHIDYLRNNTKLLGQQTNSEQSLSDQKRSHFVSDLVSCQNLYFQVQHTLEKTDDLLIYAKNYRHENNSRPSIVEILRTKNIFQYALTLRPMEKIFWVKLENNEYKEIVIRALASLLLGFFLAWVCRKLAIISKDLSTQYVFLKAATYLPLFIPLACVYHFLYEVFVDTLERPRILVLLLVSLIYLFIRFVLECYFQVNSIKQNPTWMQKIKKILLIILNVFYITAVLRFFVLNGLEHNPLEQILVFAYFICVNLLLLGLWIRFLLIMTDIEYYAAKKAKTVLKWRYLSIFIVCFLSALKVSLLIFGFYEFSINYLIFMFVLSFVFIRMIGMLAQFERYLQSGKNMISKNMYRFLGVHQKKNIYELTFLRYMLIVYLGISLGGIILWVIGVPQYYLVQFRNFFYQPQTIGHMQFVFIDFIYAGVSFCVLMLFGKLLAKQIIEAQNFKQQVNLATTVSILVRYGVFSITLITCFLILGFNFTQITVLLGGIGLGLGVGLQTLVLDFIAGIIILFQKSVNIADYVTINDSNRLISGYVQKIMLLSTQIITDDQSLLYLPNSILIKGTVNNHSSYQTIDKCILAFELRSLNDYERAKPILLDIIAQEKNMIQVGPDKPCIIMDTVYSKKKELIPVYVMHLVFTVKDVASKQETSHQLIIKIYNALNQQGIHLDNLGV